MIAVIFEVWPADGHKQHYLDHAMSLREELKTIAGFISVERFESIVEEGKMLSLSFFESEEDVMAWRNTLAHRKAQALGKNKYFANYRLRIAEVQRDYGPVDRDEVPEDSRVVNG